MKQQTQTPDTTKKIFKAINIQYDTDGQKVDLPTSLEIEIPEGIEDDDIEEYISGEISDRTGWCHFGFDTVPELPNTKIDPPPTKQSYVEPVDTKTTNGKWEVDDTSVNGISIWANEERDNGILIASVWREARGEEAEANAKLISQSKEIAKALQDIVNDWIGEGSFRSEPELKTHNDKTVGGVSYWTPATKQVKAELIAKAQSILKQAGLTK